MANLTEEQKSAINNYGEKIVSYKNDIEAIRHLQGVYISHKGTLGHLTLIREIFQNATDQISDPNSPCDLVQIEFNEKTLETTVIDNGMGIPFDDMIRIYTKNHTSGNYIKEKGDVLYVDLNKKNGLPSFQTIKKYYNYEKFSDFKRDFLKLKTRIQYCPRRQHVTIFNKCPRFHTCHIFISNCI